MQFSRKHFHLGFTLIELLVVIAIISLLSSVVFGGISSARKKAYDTNRVSTILEIQKALDLYYADHGFYPLFSNGNDYGNSLRADFLDSLVSGGYLPRQPKDPLNNNTNNFWYETYRLTPGGKCGQIYELNFSRQNDTTTCPGGWWVTPTHCHIFYPKELNCSDPHDSVNGNGIPADCVALFDSTGSCP